MSSLSIILPYAQDARHTVLRVRSALRYSPPDSEVIIVGPYGDAAQLERLRALLQNLDRIQLLIGSPDDTIATIWTRALKRSRGRTLTYLLPGIRFDKQANLAAMVSRCQQSGVGAVGCLLLDAKQKYILHAGLFKLGSQPFAILYQRQKLAQAIRRLGSRTFPYDIRKSRPVSAVIGVMTLRRDVLQSQRSFLAAAGTLSAEQLMVSLCQHMNHTGYQTWMSGSGRMIAEQPISNNFQPLIRTNDAASGPDPFLPELDNSHLPTDRPELPSLRNIFAAWRRHRPVRSSRSRS